MIVFCTTCKNRTQHLEITLPKNIIDNADYKDCKFIVLDYSSKDHLRDYIESNHKPEMQNGRLVVYSLRCPWAFRMAHAKNLAHRLGIIEGGDILVNLDADNFTGPGFAKYIAEQFKIDKNILLWSRWNLPGSNVAHIPKGCSGRIAVTKEAFLKSGGYDELKYPKWGPDDKDFHYRLRKLGYTPKEIEPAYLNAILHNDRTRFREYPDANPKLNKNSDASHDPCPPGQPVTDTDSAIANYGKIGEGVVFKNFGTIPIKLKPLPTRIFGIGMHKTATTSLHRALVMLGFESSHWKSVQWAKRIWEEMEQEGNSLTLERSGYSASDLPITILYEKLDAAYPGSKFILTIRDEKKWLSSIHNHWGKSNTFRDTWMKDAGFSHKIHSIVYGQSEFDPTVFLERYRRHNYEVMQYFRNRPDDLLVMNMDDGSGWNELCVFLDKQPPIGYPREFVSNPPITDYQI